jgi:hypothetical protein
MKAGLFAIAFGIGVVCAAPIAQAHSVGWSINPEDDAVVLQFSYGGGDPMAFAEVSITAPDGHVYQKGRADRAGKFAVVLPADANGADWTVAVVDGEGHHLTAVVQAGSEARVLQVRDVLGQAMGALALGLLMATVILAVQLWDLRQQKNPAKQVF